MLGLVRQQRRVTEHRLRETARSQCSRSVTAGDVSEQEAPAGCACCDWLAYVGACVIGEFGQTREESGRWWNTAGHREKCMASSMDATSWKGLSRIAGSCLFIY